MDRKSGGRSSNLVGEQGDRPMDANSLPPSPLCSDGYGSIWVAASEGRHLQRIDGKHKVVRGSEQIHCHCAPPKWNCNGPAPNPVVTSHASMSLTKSGTLLQIYSKSSTNCQFQYLTGATDKLRSWRTSKQQGSRTRHGRSLCNMSWTYIGPGLNLRGSTPIAPMVRGG
jgi:hypothetical protein